VSLIGLSAILAGSVTITESIGIVLNTIEANSLTEDLTEHPNWHAGDDLELLPAVFDIFRESDPVAD
jgi:hypothetical protein